MTYLFLSFAIISEVIGTTLIKNTNGFTLLLPTVVTLLAYGISFYFLSLCVQTIPTAIVYAIWSGLGIVLIAIAGFLINKQVLDLPAIIGILLIITGVIVIKVFSKAV